MKKLKNFEYYEGMLIVVDMINGFVKGGDLADSKIGDLVPRQIELIKDAQAKGKLIVFIQDTHEKDSIEHKRFNGAIHCLNGTDETEIIDELKEFVNGDNTISMRKNSTSFMEAPSFRKIIREANNIKKVDVIGCCTDICVMNGTMGLANFYDQWNRNVNIRVHQDAIATFAEDARQNYVDAAYLLMEQQGIQLIKKK